MKLLRNSAFNLGSQGLTLLAALICVPIAFRHLSTERFGLLTLMWSLLSYAIVFDLGTGPAVARATAASLVHDKGERIAAIVRAGVMLQLALGCAAGLIVAIMAPVILDLLKIPASFAADAQLSLYALALALPIVLLIQSQQAVLEGLERFDLIAYVRTPVAVATYVVPAWGALAGWSIARMIFTILLARLVGVVVLHLMYRRTRPPGQRGLMAAELPALFKYGRWLAVSGILTQLLIYLDRFVLGALRGLGAVAQYGAPYDAATKLLMLPGSIGVAMFPGLAKDAARQQTGDARARARAAGRTTMMVLVPVCALLMVFAGPLLHLWLGPKLTDAGVNAFRILLLATLFHAASFAPTILIEAMGRSDAVARYYIIEILIYAPALWFAVGQFGIAGAAWTWVIRCAAVMTWSLWYANR